jgi:hypothetical protein
MIEWLAFTVTILAVACNAFVILPWNLLLGLASCVLWCVYAFKEELTAVFWINVIMGAIYLFGYVGYLLL